MTKYWSQDDTGLPNNNLLLNCLAIIPPLSISINFIDFPRFLHLHELTGQLPLWCWTIAPAGIRLLLSDPPADRRCILDQRGNSQSLNCIDCLDYNVYDVDIPHTLRLCCDATHSKSVENARGGGNEYPFEVIHVSGAEAPPGLRTIETLISTMSTFGWALLIILLRFSWREGLWYSFAFLLIVPLTGRVICQHRGTPPFQLRIEGPGNNKQIVVVRNHENDSEWKIFHGESAIVNRLLRQPLESQPSGVANSGMARMILRGLIISQWALAIFAVASGKTDSFIISSCVILTFISNTYIFTADRAVKIWMSQNSNIRLDRYTTSFSSKRALLTTIAALNPDPHPLGANNGPRLQWIRPDFKDQSHQARWEEATDLAIREMNNESVEMDWAHHYRHFLWFTLIEEGIDVAKRIKREMISDGLLP